MLVNSTALGISAIHVKEYLQLAIIILSILLSIIRAIKEFKNKNE